MDIGEGLVAAYFKYVEGVQLLTHHVPADDGEGVISLIAIDPARPRAVLCDITTHVGGLQLGSNSAETLELLRRRVERMRRYAGWRLQGWHTELQIWSPVVAIGVAARLINLETEFSPSLTIVVNERYTQRIEQLKEAARVDGAHSDDPAFRLLQILARLR